MRVRQHSSRERRVLPGEATARAAGWGLEKWLRARCGPRRSARPWAPAPCTAAAPNMDPPALSVNSLTKEFAGKHALRDVSFAVRPGAVTALLGPNGAGKTTTLRILVDLIRPDAGTVEVFGRRLDRASLDRIGYLPEERGLYPKARVIDSLCYFASLKGLPRSDSEPRARQMLAAVGLEPHLESRCEELSKGMQQKVQLLGAILHQPEVVLLDEPFAGLDPVSIRQVRAQIRRLRGEGKAVLLSTHLMAEAEMLCDDVVMLSRGRLVLRGLVAELRSRFADEGVWRVACETDLRDCPAVQSAVAGDDGHQVVTLREDARPAALLSWLAEQQSEVQRVERCVPSLEQIFLRVVGEAGEEPAPSETAGGEGP